MNLDINDLRIAVTVLSFVTFVGICWWALSGRRTAAFAEAARLAIAIAASVDPTPIVSAPTAPPVGV